MFRVALIGCGKIARTHADFLRKFDKTKIVGVCDKFLERARIFSEKYNITYYTDSLAELIDECSPDVVHVLTPSNTHAEITIQSLNQDCHVFIEKPLCTTVAEAEQIIEVSEKTKKQVSVDHSLLQDPFVLKARKILQKGRLGEIIHIEVNISDDYLHKFRKGTNRVWVNGQIGGIFADLLPHPLYVALSFIDGLKLKYVDSRIGNYSFPENLNIFMSSSKVTAIIHISLSIFPIQQNVKLYCTDGILTIDYRNFNIIVEKNLNLPSPVQRVYLNISKGLQLLGKTISGFTLLLMGQIHPYSGLRKLVEDFYLCLENNTSPPVSIYEGKQVVEIMESIWGFVYKDKPTEHSENLGGENRKIFTENNQNPNILVTGTTGYVGRDLTKQLVEQGNIVRVLCRRSSDTSKLPNRNIEIVYGDMRDINSLCKAVTSVDTVFHCASTMRGSWYDHYEGTVQGTKNLLELAEKYKVKKFVHVSSMGIFNLAGFKGNQTINEDSELEKHHDYRGYYTKAKLLQENIVKEYIKRDKINISIIRPAIVYDNDFSKFISDAALKIKGLLLIPGIKKRLLRIVNKNDLIDALILVAKHNKARGKIYNIVDSHLPTARRYCKSYLKHHQKRGVIIKIPAILFYLLLGTLDRTISFLPGQKRRHLTYKFTGIIKNLKYDNSKIKNDLGWISSNSLME